MPDSEIIVSASPHIRSPEEIPKIMWSVFLALLPAGIWGVYAFGIRALYLIIASILSAISAEALLLKLRKKPIAITDGSAALTGLLLAYNVSPRLPIWCICIGAIFAIIIGKQVFGGLGRNIFNPALAGRVFLMASWPTYMVTFSNPRWQIDAVTTATPLSLVKQGSVNLISYFDLFIGKRAGCIGEIFIIGLLLGALFLLYKGYISWHIPFTYIFTVGLLSWMFASNKLFSEDWLFYILSGGLILGAFFMATDMVTSPLTGKGKIIFGAGCGVLTFVIRKWGGYPEGVSYSILIMNAAVPLIDRFIKPKRYGVK